MKKKKEKQPNLPPANSRWRRSEKNNEINDPQMYNQSPINLPQQIQDLSSSSTNIIQCNSKGIANEKAELMELISKEKSDALCIQETMLLKQTNFNLKNYNGLFKEEHPNHRAHGGVAIFIRETIPYQNLLLSTNL